jgi:ferredoxin
MAHVITDDCVCCGSCIDACPVEAISEGDSKYVIDADKCVDCGACVGECPSEAIKPA